MVVSKPKTRSGEDRVVDLDAGTVFVLRVWRARQEQERTRTDAKDSGYVFTGPDGHHWNPVYVTHHFRQLVQAAGLPRCRLHDLRHLAASLQLAAGVVWCSKIGSGSLSCRFRRPAGTG